MATQPTLTSTSIICPVCSRPNADWRVQCEACEAQLRSGSDTTDHQPTRPELKAEPTGSFGCLLTFLIFTLMLIAGSAYVAVDYITSIRLQKEGVQVSAKVVDIDARRTCDDNDYCTDIYSVSYAFTTPDARQMKGTDSVNSDTYAHVQIGDTWPVVYARTNPTIYKSRYSYRPPEQMVEKMWIAQVCFLSIFVFLLSQVLPDWWRARHFQRESTLTQGVITQRWYEKHQDEGGETTSYFIAYTFREGEETKAINEYRYYHSRIGAPITVRYLPSNPLRSRPEW